MAGARGVGGGDGWEEERYISASAPQDCGEAPGGGGEEDTWADRRRALITGHRQLEGTATGSVCLVAASQKHHPLPPCLSPAAAKPQLPSGIAADSSDADGGGSGKGGQRGAGCLMELCSCRRRGPYGRATDARLQTDTSAFWYRWLAVIVESAVRSARFHAVVGKKNTLTH